jgi:hypothetical protein
VPHDDALALLELRAESLAARGEVDGAAADAESMRAVASEAAARSPRPRADRPRPRADALGSLDAADKTPSSPSRTARKSRKKLLVALALSQLATARFACRKAMPRSGTRPPQRACSRTSATSSHHGRALWVVACAEDILGHRAKSERAADGALVLARRTGDRWGEASALQHPLAAARRPCEATALDSIKRLPGYLASGHVSGQAAIYNNLALAYRALGLYRHSNRMAHLAIEIRRRLHDFDSAANALMIVGGNDTLMGNAAVRAPALRRHRGHIQPSRT